jgi:hypothetical protein
MNHHHHHVENGDADEMPMAHDDDYFLLSASLHLRCLRQRRRRRRQSRRLIGFCLVLVVFVFLQFSVGPMIRYGGQNSTNSLLTFSTITAATMTRANDSATATTTPDSNVTDDNKTTKKKPTTSPQVDNDETVSTTTTVVYHIGQDGPYGRNNNRLISILHATDYVYEYHNNDDTYHYHQQQKQQPQTAAAVDRTNSTTSSSIVIRTHAPTLRRSSSRAVVAVWGWASKTLREFFGDNDNLKHLPWPIQLECMFLLEQHNDNRITPLASFADHCQAQTGVNSNNASDGKTNHQHHHYDNLPILIHGTRLSAWNLQKNSDSDIDSETPTTKHIYLNTKETYLKRFVGAATSSTTNSSSSSRVISKVVQKRRRHVLKTLFQNVPQRHLSEYHALQSFLRDRRNAHSSSSSSSQSSSSVKTYYDISKVPYIAIHSRWLEGLCEQFVGPLLSHDECYMTPTYIKRLLSLDDVNTGLVINTNTTTIVIIGDGQNPKVSKDLMEDFDIGPRLVVLPDNLTSLLLSSSSSKLPVHQPVSDMMVAIHSDVFIGTRASTMATMIGQVRVVLNDADLSSNLVYTYEEHDDNDIDDDDEYTTHVIGNEYHPTPLKVCGECIFWCNKNETHVCGTIDIHN